MCGLIGAIQRVPGEKTSAQLVADQLEKQINRGRQGFGIVGIGKDRSVSIVRTMSAERVYAELAQFYHPIVLLHHRAPTSTSNTHSQTHPIVVKNKELKFDWLVMHNGIISNDHELHSKHTTLGYEYTTKNNGTEYSKSAGYHYAYESNSFNDSEAFAIELVRFMERKSDVINISGSAAFIAVQMEKNKPFARSIIVGTNRKNPMVLDDFDGIDRVEFASQLDTGYQLESTSSCPDFNSLFMDVNKLFVPNKKTEKMFDAMVRQELAFAPEIKLEPTAYDKYIAKHDHRSHHDYMWNGIEYVPNQTTKLLAPSTKPKQETQNVVPSGTTATKNDEIEKEIDTAETEYQTALTTISDRVSDQIIELVDTTLSMITLSSEANEITELEGDLIDGIEDIIEKKFVNIVKAQSAILRKHSDNINPEVDMAEMADYHDEIDAYTRS